MGLNTIPAVSGLTRNVVAFTSSQTWTVPSTAQYVDVLVVGGGSGGRGGYRVANNGCVPGRGGAVVVAKNIYLGGTGTVAIVVGAGSNGNSGSATTTFTGAVSNAGYSGFGNYVYAGGSTYSLPGYPGYKGSTASYGWGLRSGDPNLLANTAPIMAYTYGFSGIGSQQTTGDGLALGIDSIGLVGGYWGNYEVTNMANDICGGGPSSGQMTTGASNRIWTIATPNWFNVNSYIGAATAGTLGGAGGTAGPAGITGIAGGGGSAYYGTGQHGSGGPGGGGGGGNGGAQLGGSGNGGNGGNAGANTGAGGGSGGNTGSTTAGTGGNGGNGAAGIVLVSWLG